jgi:hypothetical protein
MLCLRYGTTGLVLDPIMCFRDNQNFFKFFCFKCANEVLPCLCLEVKRLDSSGEIRWHCGYKEEAVLSYLWGPDSVRQCNLGLKDGSE